MMSLISAQSLKVLVDARAIQQATVVADQNVFKIMVQHEETERIVSVRTREGRSQERLFRSLDAAARFLRDTVHLDHYHVDAANFAHSAQGAKRPDTAQRLRGAHAALAHTQWLEQKVSTSRAALVDGTNARIEQKEWDAVRAAKLALRRTQ